MRRRLTWEAVLGIAVIAFAIFGLHVFSTLQAGQIGVRQGPLMAASDKFTITVTGRQTHGSSPWAGIDPVVAAADKTETKAAEPPSSEAKVAAPGPTTPTSPPADVKAPDGDAKTAGKEPKSAVDTPAEPKRANPPPTTHKAPPPTSSAGVAPPPPTRPKQVEKSPPVEKSSPPPPKDTGKASGGDSCDEVSCVLNNYEGACCAKFKRGGGKPSSGGSSGGKSDLPESLDRAMISDGVAKVKARVMSCGERSPAKGQVKVSVKVSPDGQVTSVTVKNTPDANLGNCVQSMMQKATFAKTQTGGSFSYPYTF